MSFEILTTSFGTFSSLVSSKVSETYTDVTKPVYDYFKLTSQEIEQTQKETRRQQIIEGKKETYNKNNNIRKQYGIETKKKIIKLINDSMYTCDVVFVNDDNAKNENDAIAFANRVVNSGYLDHSQSIKNTKKVTLSTSSSIDLIFEEFEAYFIILYAENQFIALDKKGFIGEDIKIKNEFGFVDEIASSKWSFSNLIYGK